MCCSSSSIRRQKPHVKDRGLPCFTPSASCVVIGQKGGCAPLTNGRCYDCPGWAKLGGEPSWRLQREGWRQFGRMVSATVLHWRAASDAYVQFPMRNARSSTHKRQPLRGKANATDDIASDGKRTCPRL